MRLALRDQEQAGIDIVTDGEQTRRHFVTTFIEKPRRRRLREQEARCASATATTPTCRCVVGPVARRRPVYVDDARFLRARRPSARSSSRCPAR